MHLTLSQLAAIAATTPLLVSASPALAPRQNQKVTVDLTKKYQTIDGFGFSGAFQRANLIVNLKEPKQSEVLNLLFNTTSGAGFSIVRNGIGSSKDSSKDYMNTILPNCPSTPDGTPEYKWDGKDSGQVFLSQKAVEFGVTQFYANAWSAPGCMKTNGNDANGGKLCGVRRISYPFIFLAASPMRFESTLYILIEDKHRSQEQTAAPATGNKPTQTTSSNTSNSTPNLASASHILVSSTSPTSPPRTPACCQTATKPPNL
jgi:hypothetical protein